MEWSRETAQFLADTARIANELAGPPSAAVPEKTDEPRPRKPVRFLADHFHREADGPAPAELPRRTRRMRVPDATAFHHHARRRRKPL